MKNLHKPLRTLVSTAIIGIITTSAVNAAGFSLYNESSPYAVGNFGAGIAAEAADASTGWFNPAGLSLLHEQQVVVGGVGIFPKVELNGTSTFVAPPIAPFVQTFSGLNGGENALIPSVHYAQPLGQNSAFGFSIVAPFGLATDWDVGSPVRYEATFTEVITTTFAPELSTQFSENFAAGIGLDLQYARVKLNRMLGLPTIFGTVIPPFNPAGADTLSYNKAHSFGVGFHAGVMGMFNDQHTRIGLNYQSKVRHDFHGYSELSGPLATPGGNIFGPLSPFSIRRSGDLGSNQVQLPDIVTLSAYQDLNEAFALVGSVVYTGWDVFQEIQLRNVAAPVISPTTGDIAAFRVNSVSPQNYNNAWRFALGANYKFNDKIMLRVGGGYDETPTNNIDRDVRLPDVDRWALAVGAHYQMRDSLGFDIGYQHLFAVNPPAVNRTDVLTPTSSFTVNATGTVHADLVGVQAVWTMDKVTAPTK